MKKILLFLFTLFTLQSFGQNYQWYQYGRCREFDAVKSVGNDVWVASGESLIRMNKNTGQLTYFNASNSSLLWNEMNNIMYRNNQLWVVEDGSGLAKWNGTDWVNYNATNSSIPYSEIFSSGMDSLGNIWYKDLDDIREFDGVNVTTHPLVPGSHIPVPVYVTKSGDVWAALHRGDSLSQFNGIYKIVSGQFQFQDSLPFSNVLSFPHVIADDEFGGVYMQGGGSSLHRYKNGTWKQYIIDSLFGSTPTINNAVPGYNGHVYFGTGLGVAVLNLVDSTWSNLNLPVTGSCRVDYDGSSLWITCEDYGLFKYDLSSGQYSFYDLANTSAQTYQTSLLLIDQFNNKWFNYYQNPWGIQRLNPDGSVDLFNSSNSPVQGVIYKMVIDDQGHYWMACNGKMIEFDGTNFIVHNSPDSTLAPEFMDIDQNGLIWMFSFHHLYSYDRDTTWKLYYSNNSPISADPAVNLGPIHVDKMNRKWFADSYHQQLFVYNDTTWTIYDSSGSQLPSFLIRTIESDDSSNVWIGTDDGLVKFDGTNWQTFNDSNSGLRFNGIFDLKFDSIRHSMWISNFSTGSYAQLAYYKRGEVVNFDGTNWTHFGIENSNIACSSPFQLEIDSADDVWATQAYMGLNIYAKNPPNFILNPIVVPLDVNPVRAISTTDATLFPNPATTSFFIESQSANISSITIHDILGREVLSLNNLNEKKLSVPLTGFSAGVYLVNIKTDKGEVVKKVVVE